MEIIHDSVYLFGLTERKYYFRVFSVWGSLDGFPQKN